MLDGSIGRNGEASVGHANRSAATAHQRRGGCIDDRVTVRRDTGMRVDRRSQTGDER